jgi:polyhydroxyalkanoate synthase
VNNYLLGKSPPTFDILYWNNDSTNLPAQLHSDFLDIIVGKALARPGDLSVCDTPIDLTKVTCDSFITAGITDHLTPWKACYRTTGLIGGNKEFVLSSSGHIQSLLTPPGNPRAKYFTNDDLADTPDEWLNDATQQEGSWWTRWSVWLEQRSGTKKLAPKKIGNAEYPAISIRDLTSPYYLTRECEVWDKWDKKIWPHLEISNRQPLCYYHSSIFANSPLSRKWRGLRGSALSENI